MEIKTLAERWDEVDVKLFNEQTRAKMPAADFDSMRGLVRSAFYIGVSTMNEIFTLEVTAMPDDDGVEYIESFQKELRVFAMQELERALRFSKVQH